MSVVVVLCAAEARADEPLRLGLFDRRGPLQIEDAEEPAVDLPRFRIEGAFQLTALARSKVKKGPDALVSAFEPRKDGHLPLQLDAGWFAQADLVMWSWASLGAVGWATHARGPKRNIHYEGITLNGRSFPGGTRLRTEIEIQYAEVSLRYIWRRDADLHLWFGIGPAWISYRIALRGTNARATGRIEVALGPSFTYALAARVKDWLSLFLESGFAVAPTKRYPSIVAGTRVGLRLHLGAGLELVVALNNRVGLLAEATSAFGSVTSGHRWRRAGFFLLGAEVGLAFSI